MQRQKAILLKQEAEKLAEIFSKPNREYNGNNETFKVEKINPKSDTVATVVYRKSSGKFALQLFLWSKDRWFSLFLTESHIEGLRHSLDDKQKIEVANFGFNFVEPPKPTYNVPYEPEHEFD